MRVVEKCPFLRGGGGTKAFAKLSAELKAPSGFHYNFSEDKYWQVLEGEGKARERVKEGKNVEGRK